jgi:hypothetical protein
MATRNFHVFLTNATPYNLKRTGGNLDEGVWTNDRPYPDAISAGTVADWESESGGEIPIIGGSVGQGTEGWVEYKIEGATGDIAHIDWDNPFVGVASANARVVADFSGQVSKEWGFVATYTWSDGSPMQVVGTDNSVFNWSSFSEAQVSITLTSKRDVKMFLRAARFDFSRGLRALRPGPFSLRSLTGA